MPTPPHARGGRTYARDRFQRIFEERCKGPYAANEGRIAYEGLRNMAVQLNDMDEIERLARDLQERQCTFGEEAPPIGLAGVDRDAAVLLGEVLVRGLGVGPRP